MGLAVFAASMPIPLAVIAAVASQAAESPPARHEHRPAMVASAPITPPADRHDTSGFSRAEMRCLARAVYHEARGEPLEGQIAVAEVVIARSRDRRWKGDLCRTIRMPDQFFFVKGGRTSPIEDPEAAQRMMDLARDVASGRLASRAKGALYYHADYAHPVWRHDLKLTARIKTHIFYADPETPRNSTRTSTI